VIGTMQIEMLVQLNENPHDVVQGSPTNGEEEPQGQQHGDDVEKVDDHVSQSKPQGLADDDESIPRIV
jgi:hypothetical protein